MSNLFNQKIMILRAPSLGATRDPFDGPGASPGLESTAQNIAERAVSMTVESDENPPAQLSTPCGTTPRSSASLPPCP
ncbi:hypothetical protein [Pseudarthrobacter oxydans]|uniref:hypothetical protein n=1 Tax=Pseudarthrobacter oxydans TaxID=1671 RepID=UPI00345029FD